MRCLTFYISTSKGYVNNKFQIYTFHYCNHSDYRQSTHCMVAMDTTLLPQEIKNLLKGERFIHDCHAPDISSAYNNRVVCVSSV